MHGAMCKLSKPKSEFRLFADSAQTSQRSRFPGVSRGPRAGAGALRLALAHWRVATGPQCRQHASGRGETAIRVSRTGLDFLSLLSDSIATRPRSRCPMTDDRCAV